MSEPKLIYLIHCIGLGGIHYHTAGFVDRDKAIKYRDEIDSNKGASSIPSEIQEIYLYD